jgi:hypothetical protein
MQEQISSKRQNIYSVVHLFMLIEFINQISVYVFLSLIHPIRSVAGKMDAVVAGSLVEGAVK